MDFQKDEQALHIQLKIELLELSEIPAVISCVSEEWAVSAALLALLCYSCYKRLKIRYSSSASVWSLHFKIHRITRYFRSCAQCRYLLISYWCKGYPSKAMLIIDCSHCEQICRLWRYLHSSCNWFSYSEMSPFLYKILPLTSWTLRIILNCRLKINIYFSRNWKIQFWLLSLIITSINNTINWWYNRSLDSASDKFA